MARTFPSTRVSRLRVVFRMSRSPVLLLWAVGVAVPSGSRPRIPIFKTTSPTCWASTPSSSASSSRILMSISSPTTTAAGFNSAATRPSPVPRRWKTTSPDFRRERLRSSARGARTINWHSVAGFVQDDWRIQPRLMINLGMRYSFVSPLHEANNLWGNFDPTLGMVQQGQPSVGNTIVKPDYGNFSPRAGFAWDVTGKGTTIVRGGASMLYSTYSTTQFMQASQQNFGGGGGLQTIPTGACTTSVPVGTPCPQTFGGTELQGVGTIPSQNLNWSVDGKTPVFTASAGLACTAKLPCNLITVDPNLRTPYIVNYNLGVQHAFTNDLSLEVGYVGNHGDNLTNFVDLNQLDPVTGVRPYGAKFPYLKYINRTTNDGISNYNSLQTTLTKRLSQGLDFTAGYTYGHGLDNGSLSRFGNLPQNSLNPQAEYASGDFDIRHRFTLTAGYAIPGKKGFGQLLEGWKLNSIVTFQTGQPWLVNDGTDNFIGTGESTDRWNFSGNPADFQSGSQSLPYCAGFVPGQRS